MILSLSISIWLIWASREIIENAVAPKSNKFSGPEYAQLTELLVAKDQELKETLKLAAEQVI